MIRLFVIERERPRMGNVGFETPIFEEREVKGEVAPLLVTNARGTFVPTRISQRGVARYAFSHCPIEQESRLVGELHRVLTETSLRQGWSNRCSSVSEAVDRLRTGGVIPRSLVISDSLLPSICGPDYDLASVRRLMAAQGFVTMVDGMQVILGDLPEGAALVAAAPAGVGYYKRIGDHLGVLVQRVNRALMVVNRVA
jgi:hypothetical protein